jgi:hypothetical protein
MHNLKEIVRRMGHDPVYIPVLHYAPPMAHNQPTISNCGFGGRLLSSAHIRGKLRQAQLIIGPPLIIFMPILFHFPL